MMPRMRMVAIALAISLFAIMPLCAGMQVVLRDGTVLEITDMKRRDGNYLFSLADGETITLPAALVDTVRLTGVGDAPSGMRTGEPETLVGETIPLPERKEQLEKLGPSSRFRYDVVDNSWRPSTDWNMDPGMQNNFAPSTWHASVIEPIWFPKSAWAANRDVLASGRTIWRKSIFDSSWSPTDGFGNRSRFP